MMRWICASALFVALGGCDRQPPAGSGATTQPAASGAAATPARTPWKIAVIPKGTTHDFWKSVHAGAVKEPRARSVRTCGAFRAWLSGPVSGVSGRALHMILIHAPRRPTVGVSLV